MLIGVRRVQRLLTVVPTVQLVALESKLMLSKPATVSLWRLRTPSSSCCKRRRRLSSRLELVAGTGRRVAVAITKRAAIIKISRPEATGIGTGTGTEIGIAIEIGAIRTAGTAAIAIETSATASVGGTATGIATAEGTMLEKVFSSFSKCRTWCGGGGG